MKGSKSVSEGTTGWRERAIRCDHSLLNLGVAPRNCHDLLETVGITRTEGLAGRPQDINKEGLNHKAVVVVPVKLRAVSVNTVSQIPVVYLVESQADPDQVTFSCQPVQGCLNHGAEENPIVSIGNDHTGSLQSCN